MSQSTQQELTDKITAAAARRKAKQAASKDAAVQRRLENEARIGDIEESTGLTLGVDLGVVWCPNGDMVLVRAPDQLTHERHQLKAGQGEVTAQDLDRLLKAPTVVYPAEGFTEQVWSACPGAKIAAANIAMALAAPIAASAEGK